LRLLSRIQDEFGKSLPPFVLFKDSTIETLETHLTSQGKILNPYGVIPIQPEGNQIPVFIVDANLRMRNLAIAMGTSRPIYDLCQYKGGQNGVHASVQEIAKTYYQCLIDYYPQGPYLLLGHSAHGFLALELARLLQKEKKKVAFLGLLDTFPPPPFLLQVKYKIERHLFNLQGKNLLEILKYVGRFAQRWIAHSQNAPAPVNLVEQNQSKRPIKKDKEVINLPYPPYKPKRFDGQVTLFSTNDRTSSSESDPMEKWMKIFTGPFEIVPIPGDHLSMFHPPHVAVLAGKIKLLLAQQEAELIQDKKVEGTCPGRERLG
jgi:thioesterase domain-containing protein